MMLLILATLLLPPSATASNDLGLCARIGAQGQSLTPRASLPMSIERAVRFQLCTSDARPVADQVNVTLTIEPLTPAGSSSIAALDGIVTDRAGRFNMSYAAGVPVRELHLFSIDGRVVAAFLLERTPDSVEFSRTSIEGCAELLRKNLQDQGGSRDYPE